MRQESRSEILAGMAGCLLAFVCFGLCSALGISSNVREIQLLMMAACLKARGTTIFAENIFRSRFRQADELKRLGANIRTEGSVAVVTGVERLIGAPVVSEDLRGGASLVIAGLSAQGETVVTDPGHIERGYEHLDASLRKLGAQIEASES